MFVIDAVNEEAKESGIWVDYDHETRLKIAYSQNPKYLKLRDSLVKRYGKGKDNELDSETERFINVKCIAEAVLVDWEGIVTSDGSEVEYSAEMSFQALDKNPDFLAYVINVATEIENYRQEQNEQTAKK